MEIEFFLIFIFSLFYLIFTLYQITLLLFNFNKNKLHLIFSFIFLMILIFYSKKIKDYKNKINFFIIVMDSILTLNYYLFLFKIDIFSLIDRML